jgi:imidazole glycerol phosphate synthase glutamine amidotransferase subunit
MPARAAVTIIDNGSGNVHSVANAFRRVGAEAVLTGDPDAARRAERLVLPGQGSFSSLVALRERGLDQAVREVIDRGNPYLGICLGLQMLFESSEEAPVAGLGVLPGKVVRFAPANIDRKVPHMGWNEVRARRPDPLLTGLGNSPHFYFVHSYYAAPADPDLIVLTCDYGGDFTAAVRRDNLVACQFHPEKSQRAGLALLDNFVSSRA